MYHYRRLKAAEGWRSPGRCRAGASLSTFSSQEQFGRGVGEAQALARELKTVGRDPAPALPGKLVHFRRPFAAKIVAGRALKFLERPARDETQSERRGLAGAG